MKKAILPFVFFLFACSSMGGERDLSEMKAIAAQMLAPAHTRAAHAPSTALLQVLQEKTKLCVIGYPGGAYVVVSSDDNYEPVLGYADRMGSEANPAFEWWLNAVNDAMESEMLKPTSRSYQLFGTAYPDSVGPLLRTTWNQGYPYNEKCPVMKDGKHYPTGCVATAMSQIMKYHSYPDRGVNSHQYAFTPDDGDSQTLFADFENTTFNWNEMLDSYSGISSDSQKDAVSTLMSLCGIAVDMAYNPTGSGAYSVEAAQGIQLYFGYNENLRFYRREYYGDSTWLDIIYREINSSRPIYYAGVDKGGTGGHAFVVDGYDSKGRVHVNWGWGGKSDGFYDLTLLNPSGYEYSVQQEMVCCICKPDVDIPYISQLGANGSITFNPSSMAAKLSVTATVQNLAVKRFEGSFAIIAQNADTFCIVTQKDGFAIKPLYRGYSSGTTVRMGYGDFSNLPDGTYRVYLASKGNAEQGWQPVRTTNGVANSVMLTKTGSQVSVEPQTSDAWTGISTLDVAPGRMCRGIYTLDGKRMFLDKDRLAPGVYIVDGKKVVKRH